MMSQRKMPLEFDFVILQLEPPIIQWQDGTIDFVSQQQLEKLCMQLSWEYEPA